jgi:hypothetical protein
VNSLKTDDPALTAAMFLMALAVERCRERRNPNFSIELGEGIVRSTHSGSEAPHPVGLQVIDTVDCCAWIVDCGRNCLQCNINDLEHAKFDVLLHGPHRPDNKRGPQFDATFLCEAVFSRNGK